MLNRNRNVSLGCLSTPHLARLVCQTREESLGSAGGPNRLRSHSVLEAVPHCRWRRHCQLCLYDQGASSTRSGTDDGAQVYRGQGGCDEHSPGDAQCTISFIVRHRRYPRAKFQSALVVPCSLRASLELDAKAAVKRLPRPFCPPARASRFSAFGERSVGYSTSFS